MTQDTVVALLVALVWLSPVIVAAVLVLAAVFNTED